MSTVLRGIGQWINEYTELLAILLLIAMLLMFFYGLITAISQANQRQNQQQAQQVDLCVRAFEYSRDQCEFIVTNHIMVNR